MQRHVHSGMSHSLRIPAALMLAVLLGSAEIAQATHFRYGHLTWRPVTGTVIEFTLQNAWRRNGYVCRNPATLGVTPCTGADGLPGIGDVILETIGATRLDFGDGTPLAGSPLGPLMLLVTAIAPAENWLFAVALDASAFPMLKTTISHMYAAPGDYTARIASCCRISSALLGNVHVNNPDGFYKVETLVNVGTGNSPPASSMLPIVVCPQNDVCSFFVPSGDVDGDTRRHRLSSSMEAADMGVFRQPGPPFAPEAATIDQSGLYRWNTTGALLGPPGSRTLYSTQVTIEDLDQAGNVKSKAAIDFLIELVPKIGTPPTFNTPPTVVCGATQHIPVGSSISIEIGAFDTDPDDIVQLLAVGLPLGARMTPSLPIVGNPVSSILAWTPTETQLGTTVIVFEARDSNGQQALCSQILNVIARRIEGVMTGGGSFEATGVPNNGVRHGFVIHCSPDDKPNRLQVNWAGNSFHLEQVQSASCFDNPTLAPGRPAAEFDTLIGAGEGRLNGVPGAAVEWEFTDAGEPGRDDSIRIIIRDSSGHEVLSGMGTLTGGNHQSHDR